MTPEQARDALITKVKAVLDASLSTLPVFYENTRSVPVDSVGDAVLAVRVDFQGARQASIENDPVTRYTGELCLLHMQREGTGTKAMLARAEILNSELRHLSLGALQLAVPYPGRNESHDGWFSQEWCVPFWFHQ